MTPGFGWPTRAEQRVSEHFQAEIIPHRVTHGRKQLVVDVIARAWTGRRNRDRSISIGVTMRHAAHEMTVEQEYRVPVIEQAIQAVRLDGLQFHGVTVEIEPGGV